MNLCFHWQCMCQSRDHENKIIIKVLLRFSYKNFNTLTVYILYLLCHMIVLELDWTLNLLHFRIVEF